MRKTKRFVSAVLAASMVTGMAMGTTQAWARSSKRAAWNNAASSMETGMEVRDACFVEDDSETAEHTVYSNVYADSEEWAAWQTAWQEIRDNYEQVALTPGEDATQLNFAWYSLTQENPKVRLMDENGMIIKEFEGTQDTVNSENVTEDGITLTLYPNKVTVNGLTENTSYQYAYYVDGQWSEPYEYATKSTEQFSVMYVGDPQIGASTGQEVDGETKSKEYYAMNDAYNWQHTLANAVRKHTDLSFILSAGDQINQTSVTRDADKLQQQIEYAGFLSSPVLRSLPLATTIGNHDSKSVNYSNHFNNPNTAVAAETTQGATTAGTDYYFRYGNTLFVVIDTNNYNCATHENVIKEAMAANMDATWRILMFHQDIYGSGYDHSDSDGMILRTQLTPIIDNYGFDAVLQGHDHTYSRTFQLSANGVQEAFDKSADTSSQAFYSANANAYNILTKIEDKNKVINPEGTVYFEANSATGSKYYQLIGTQQNYIAARSQSWRPTYSVLDITDVTLTVRTYDAATNEELVADGNIATSYTIVKSADKMALQTALTEAETKLEAAKRAGNYTEASVANLEAVLAEAKGIYENPEADTRSIASAVTSLNDAAADLEVITPAPYDESDERTDGVADAGFTGSLNKDNSNSPKTGDNAFSIILWLMLGGASLAGLIGLYMSEKRIKKQAVNK